MNREILIMLDEPAKTLSFEHEFETEEALVQVCTENGELIENMRISKKNVHIEISDFEDGEYLLFLHDGKETAEGHFEIKRVS